MKNAILDDLLIPVFKDASNISTNLEKRYSSFNEIAEADIISLANAISDNSAAFYLKLVGAIVSRRGCDRFKFGKKHTDEEVEEYLKHLFLGIGNEVVYVLSVGQDGRFIACDRISEGTVNFSSATPRMMLEAAKKRGAKGVIIAHNHPGGYADPSEDDVTATAILRELLLSSGIKLINHYVVAGNECLTV